MAKSLTPAPVSDPALALKNCLSTQLGCDALDGVPVRVLVEHLLHAQACGSLSAEHELTVLEILVGRWLKSLEIDIASFPQPAVDVLQQQKKELLSMHRALTELQVCLQALRPRQGRVSKLQALAWGKRPQSWQPRQAFAHSARTAA